MEPNVVSPKEADVLISDKLLAEDPGIHLMVGFRGTALEEELKLFIKDFKVGGICLFKRNIESPSQLKALLEETQSFALETLGRILLVSIDQEGGPVQRLAPHFTRLPSAHDLSLEGPDAIRTWATRAARDLHYLGIQINLAPVLDLVPVEAPHFMQDRSLGADPPRVARLGALWIQTLQDNGVSATAKHFPGLGHAESDPHHFAPVIRWDNDEEMRKDLFPFREAIASGVHCIMTSHALYPYIDPQWPATLSPGVNHEWLRRRLQFEGVLLSDDLDMAAVSGKFSWEEMAVQGVRSTIDFFLLCQRPENIEPFYRALHNVLQSGNDAALMRRASIGRIQSLLGKHAHGRIESSLT
jgi:beta-N-acetylhexosaminidase